MGSNGGIETRSTSSVVWTAAKLGFSGPILEVPPDRRWRWRIRDQLRLYHCGENSGIELLVAEGGSNERSILPKWMRELAHHQPQRRFLHAQVFPDDRVWLGIVRPGHCSGESVCIRELTPILLEEIAQIPGLTRDHLVHRWADILGRETLTRRFFVRLRSVLLRLENAWENLLPEDRDALTRRDLTITLLCRLMFVTFLSRERGLGGQRNYLRWLLEQPRSGDIYRNLLKPLFFSALNTPVPERIPETLVLGDLPYLNGGLFHPLDVERRNPDLTLSDELLSEGIHSLFERFEFLSREGQQEGSPTGIDPEMLGQAFEALMHAEERRKSGTFYTPVGVVRTLVRDILVEMAETLGDPMSRWVNATLSGGPHVSIGRRQAACLAEILDGVRILDPAVGSGSFLLGFLDALVVLRQHLASFTGVCPDPHTLRRQIIARNLYGVDVKAGAVRLCELRMWLSLIACAPPERALEPLPNLDHQVRQGDSLNEPLVQRAGRALAECQEEDPAEAERFANLHGDAKADAVRRRHGEEVTRLAVLLEALRSDRKCRLEELEALAGRLDLFGRPGGLSPGEMAQKRRLQEELHQIDLGRRALDRGELPYFSFPAAFPEVFRQGGFDVVVGNPPWVRVHEIPPEHRRFYKGRYTFCRPKGTGFEQQVDLSVVFVERALELVRPGGLVAFLLPAKVFRAQYGRVLRDRLSERYAVRRFVDYSLQRSRIFTACNYPAWLVVRNSVPRQEEVASVSLATPTGEMVHHQVQTTQLSPSRRPADVWSALPRGVLEALDTMCASRSVLADHGLHPKLGLKTGSNAVFLAAHWRECGPDQVELTMGDGSQFGLPRSMAPFVARGRDVRAFLLDPCERVLLPYDRDTLRPLSSCSASTRSYFESHRTTLSRRRDYRGGTPLWTVFRTAALRPRHMVLWRDIAPRLEAVFSPRGDLVVPLNTTYFSPSVDPDQGRLLVALLNCSWSRMYAVMLAEPAMSGYFRFFAWTLERLPWPEKLRPGSREADRLIKLSEQAAENWSSEIGHELDDLTAFLFRLDQPSRKALEAMCRFFPQLVTL